MKAFTFLKRQLKHTEEDIISQIDELDLDKPDVLSNLKILLDHSDVMIPHYKNPVSYTHLTLPTICSV